MAGADAVASRRKAQRPVLQEFRGVWPHRFLYFHLHAITNSIYTQAYTEGSDPLFPIGINVKRSREAKGSESDETSPARRAVCGKTARTVR